MKHPPPQPLRALAWAALLAGAVLAAAPAAAQSGGSRERAQMMQLQQQVQRLQAELARVQQERASDLARLAQAEQAARSQGSQVQAAQREAERLRSGQSVAQREGKRLADELQQTKDALGAAEAALTASQAEADKLRSDLARRDAALADAAAELIRHQKAMLDERGVFTGRIRQHLQRVEHCEARHGQAWALADQLVNQWEAQRTVACEPFTGLWRVKEETRVQAWRDRLFEARLDVPAGETAQAQPAVPERKAP